MAKSIFTVKYMLLLTAVLFASWATAHLYYKPISKPAENFSQTENAPAAPAQTSPTDLSLQQQYDKEVDRALQFSLEGKYYESAQILIPLAQKGYDRAQLYLAVAYYHGHGVERNKKMAEQLLFELQRKNFELGIVQTYLSMLGSIPPT